MKTIQYAGFEALVTGLVHGRDGLLYISFAGPTTSTRAIAAALVSRDTRKQASGITLSGTQSVYLERFAHYRVLAQQAEAKRGSIRTMQVGIFHSDLTVVGSNGNVLYLLTEEDADPDVPPPGFFRRLRMAVKLPLLPGWEQWLWDEGKKEVKFPAETEYGHYNSKATMNVLLQTAHPVSSYAADGLCCWRVLASQRAWVEVIRQHFDLGVRLRHGANDAQEYWEEAGKVIADGGVGLIRNKASRFWTIWLDGEAMSEEKISDGKAVDQFQGSDKVEEAVAIADLKYGVKFILE